MGSTEDGGVDSGGGDLTVDAISATDDADMVCDDATNTRIECPYPMIPYVASLPRLRLSNDVTECRMGV